MGIGELGRLRLRERSLSILRMKRFVLWLLGCALTCSCLEAADPVVLRDVHYASAEDRLRSLDVYSPVEGKGHPVVVWIHGGGWKKGDKGGLLEKAKGFVERGHVFVSINYRMLPDVSLGEMMGDVAQSIRWIRDHVSEHRGDPDALIVMGHSAGAHLAALVCTDRKYLSAAGVPMSCLKGCVPVDVSAYDIPKRIRDLDDGISSNFRSVFGVDEGVQRDFSPVTHVREGVGIPPFLILHVATRMDTREQAHWLASALTRSGIRAKVYAAEGKNHGSIGGDLGKTGDASTDEVFTFCAEVTGKK